MMYRFRAGYEPNRLTSRSEAGKGAVRPARADAGFGTWRPGNGRPPEFAELPPTARDDDDRARRSRSSYPESTPAPDSPSRGNLSVAVPVAVPELRLIGMSSREARMYLALREGARLAREATELAGLHRATGYRVLSRLVDRGLVTGDGQNPQHYRAVDLSVLLRRLELFYRDEAEIPHALAEAYDSGSKEPARGPLWLPTPNERPRILANSGRSTHPVILELSSAKHSVGAVVRPLTAPIAFRMALGRTLGRLARNGVHVRLITDATPADYRFFRVVLREAGETSDRLEVRHYSPIASQLYSIDRQKVVRVPTLGTSGRAPPVGVVVEDRARVQPLVSRFDSLWAECLRTSRPLGPGAARAARPSGAQTNRSDASEAVPGGRIPASRTRRLAEETART